MRLAKDLLARDLYAMLGVDAAASAAQIRSAYRQAIRSNHPDLHSAQRHLYEHRMTEMNVAASVLLDPRQRAAYDSQRFPQKPCSAPQSRVQHFRFWTSGNSSGTDWVRQPKPKPRKKPLDIELKRILHQLRTAPERWLWRVHEALDFATSRRLAGATFMCVLIGLTLIAWVRPYPLFSPESHERPEEVSTEAKLQR